jgi:vesicle-associated membrane protein 7
LRPEHTELTSSLSRYSSCIAHNSTILSECTTSAANNTSSLASLVLPKITHSKPEKMTYTHGSYSIHYAAEGPSEHDEPQHSSLGGLTFLAVTDRELSRRVSFGFLAEVRRRFLAMYPTESSDYSDLPTYGAGAFNGELKGLMAQFGRDGVGAGSADDAISNVRREIDDVRGIMTRNIEGLLERGERIDLLVDKTDRLGGNAREFRVRSRGLRRKMWWKNVKLMGLLGLVLVLILLATVIAVKNSVG